MTERTRCDVFICVNDLGEYAVGVDEDAAVEAYENEIGDNRPRLVYSVTLKVATPETIDGGEFEVTREPITAIAAE